MSVKFATRRANKLPNGESPMKRKQDCKRPHYHIRWDSKETLDRECLHTYSEAAIRAAELAGPCETFTIEEVSSECPLLKAKSGSAG
jgi:hypothetical protein